MARLHELLDNLLEDRKITDNEVQVIRNYIHEDGRLDLEDVKFLIELLVGANEVCPAFDELFFPVLKEVLLQDGRIDTSEQFYLLKMLYSDGHVRLSEKRFLMELRNEAKEVSPEFDELCNIAIQAHPTDWETGGNETEKSSLATSS